MGTLIVIQSVYIRNVCHVDKKSIKFICVRCLTIAIRTCPETVISWTLCLDNVPCHTTLDLLCSQSQSLLLFSKPHSRSPFLKDCDGPADGIEKSQRPFSRWEQPMGTTRLFRKCVAFEGTYFERIKNI